MGLKCCRRFGRTILLRRTLKHSRLAGIHLIPRAAPIVVHRFISSRLRVIQFSTGIGMSLAPGSTEIVCCDFFRRRWGHCLESVRISLAETVLLLWILSRINWNRSHLLHRWQGRPWGLDWCWRARGLRNKSRFLTCYFENQASSSAKRTRLRGWRSRCLRQRGRFRFHSFE